MRTVVRAPLVIFAASVAWVTLAARPARGDEEGTEAGKLAEQGTAALAQRHFETALARFRLAEMLAPSPVIALGLARAEAGINHVVAARTIYRDILEDVASRDASPDDQKAAEEARHELPEVESRMASMTIRVTGPEVAYVVLDGAALRPSALLGKQPVDPGSHVLRASSRGYRSAEAYFTVLEGGEASVVLAMGKDPDVHGEEVFKVTFPVDAASAEGAATTPTDPSSRQLAAAPPANPATRHDIAREPSLSPYRTAAVVSFGLAGVSLIVGVTANLQAVSQDQHPALALSTAGFVGACLGALTGMGLLAFEPPQVHVSSARVTPYVGLGGAGAVGRF